MTSRRVLPCCRVAPPRCRRRHVTGSQTTRRMRGADQLHSPSFSFPSSRDDMIIVTSAVRRSDRRRLSALSSQRWSLLLMQLMMMMMWRWWLTSLRNDVTSRYSSTKWVAGAVLRGMEDRRAAAPNKNISPTCAPKTTMKLSTCCNFLVKRQIWKQGWWQFDSCAS